MGVLPLVFKEGQNAESLGLTGREKFDIIGLEEGIEPRKELSVRAIDGDGREITFAVTARLDTRVEVDYYRNGGILNTVLGNFIARE
jgi:aconitate hydratase